MVAVFGVGQALWSMFWFFLFFIWVMLLFWIFADIFRSYDLTGLAKCAWILAVILLPYLGVFLYLILREPGPHTVHFQTSVGDSPPVHADAVQELQRLADLKQRGVITEEEFGRMKARLIG